MNKRWTLLLLSFGLAACSGAEDSPAGDSPDAAVADASETPTSADPKYAGLKINEVSAKGEPNDWFEIYNSGSDEIDLSGLTYRDDDTAHEAQALSGSLAAGAYLKVEVTAFGLGKSDAVNLWDPSGAVIDSVSWEAADAPEGKSYGRIPNGSGDFVTLDTPSPGAANVEGSTEPADPYKDLFINEVVAAGTEEGFELYNAGEDAIDLSALSYRDDSDEHALVALTGSLEGEAFLKVVVTDFGLGKADSVRIYNGEELVKTATWTDGDAPEDKSYGRFPDGSGDFITLDTPSLGATNVPNVAAADGPYMNLKINEVAAKGDPEDWFELYNAGAAALDLTGLSYRDGDGTHALIALPAQSLAAGAFLQVEVTEFGLGKADSVVIFDGASAVIDSVSWADGDSPEGKSYGRLPDGTGAFSTLDNPTPGAANASN